MYNPLSLMAVCATLKHGNLPPKSHCPPFLLDNMYIAILSQILTDLTSGTQGVANWFLPRASRAGASFTWPEMHASQQVALFCPEGVREVSGCFAAKTKVCFPCKSFCCITKSILLNTLEYF